MAMHLHVGDPRTLTEGEIALYTDANYSGKVYICASDIPNFADHKFNDEVSSVKLGPRTEAHLYTDQGYRGKSLDVKQNIPNLKTAGFNDTASSVRIVKH